MSTPLKIHTHVYTGPQADFIKESEAYECYCVLVIEQGSYKYGVGNDQGQASFGDLVFTPPGTFFKRKALEDVTFHVIHFTAQPMFASTATLPVGKITLRDVDRLSSTLAYMRTLYHDTSPSSDKRMACAHLLSDLLYMQHAESKYASRRASNSDPLMQVAIGHLRRLVFEEVSLQDIAERLGILPSELTRRFKLAYGITPIDFLTKQRLEESKRLLLQSTDTIDTIAIRCGYENGAYLSRIFRLKTGISPSAFRRRYQF